MHSLNEMPTNINHTDCSIEIAQTQPIIMVTKAVNRPQSPRQFFEKLYGHLETSSAASPVCDDKKIDRQYSPIFSSRHSEISSSPDISDSRYITKKLTVIGTIPMHITNVFRKMFSFIINYLNCSVKDSC